MYNAHRGMAPGAPPNRLDELLDGVRREFEQETSRTMDQEQRITNQISEMDLIRNRIFQLEQQQASIKEKYEADIARLQRELDARGGSNHLQHGGNAQLGGPSQPQPPTIGHGPSNLFGGIMAGNAGQGGPGLAPPQQEQPPPQGLPPHMNQGPQGPPGLNPAPAPPQHAPFPGYPGPGPAINGFGIRPPLAASPGAKLHLGRGPPGGPATPQQNSAAPYPGSPQVNVPRPTPPPPPNSHPMGGMGLSQHAPPPQQPLPHGIPHVGNVLADLDHEQLPDSLKRVGQDWHAVFNPETSRVLDVKLVHTLAHQSVVCCVRFSHDGRQVATGCNRSAQIFDVDTGNLIHHLQDTSLSDDGDLYIRSVCFSPDGRFLATGAEDKVIRVWDILSRTIKHSFTGHDQDIYSLDFARNGRLIASGSGDRTVRLWDIESNSQVLQLTIEDGVTTVAISPDNRYVAAGSLDKSVRVWDTQSGVLVERLEGEQGHKDSVYSVAFAPSGRELVSGSLDKTIKMWELAQPNSRMLSQSSRNGGKCVKTFEGHKDFVLSVALTPDGQWVLSGSKDRGVQFWDPITGVAQLMLQGHKNSVISVAPSPMGTLFATGSGDMRARIWSYEQYRGPEGPRR